MKKTKFVERPWPFLLSWDRVGWTEASGDYEVVRSGASPSSAWLTNRYRDTRPDPEVERLRFFHTKKRRAVWEALPGRFSFSVGRAATAELMRSPTAFSDFLAQAQRVKALRRTRAGGYVKVELVEKL